jgi:hypothetical protein
MGVGGGVALGRGVVETGMGSAIPRRFEAVALQSGMAAVFTITRVPSRRTCSGRSLPLRIAWVTLARLHPIRRLNSALDSQLMAAAP